MTPHAPEYDPGILLAHVARPGVVDGAPNPQQGAIGAGVLQQNTYSIGCRESLLFHPFFRRTFTR